MTTQPEETRPRNKAPVFVLGSPRSGTSLLYHMLLSAGKFAVFRSETHVFNLLETRFGDLSILRNKEKLIEAWFRTRMFQISGLERDEIKTKI
ncbi:MAG TPA: sulfotransferase, partial [Candidatus Sulfotelmatobacter sp.]